MVVIGDIHFPFHNKQWLSWVYSKVIQLKPTHVVQIGDLMDLYNFSRYARTNDLLTPEQEIEQAFSSGEQMWRVLRKLAPGTKCYQLSGNHDPSGRILKRIRDSLPIVESLVDLQKLMTFEGVQTLHDFTDELLLDDLCIMHGHKGLGQHAAENRMNTIVGHLHKLDIRWFHGRAGPFYEMNVGCGVDKNSPVFGYRGQKKLCQWTLGLGYVDRDGPRTIPFFSAQHGKGSP